MSLKSYENLIVWQKSMDLVIMIYEITNKFPDCEKYGLTTQMRRAAISIPSNIAEGSKRSTRKDFRYFINTAYGSGAELETQIKITERLCYVKSKDLEKIDNNLNEVMKMLNKLSSKLKILPTTHYKLPTNH